MPRSFELSRRNLIKSAAAASLIATRGGAGVAAKPKSALVAFADREIAKVASTKSVPAPEVAYVTDPGLGAQSYRIDGSGTTRFTITAGDAQGAMYGGLDVAEALGQGEEWLARLGDGRPRKPHIEQRGIKFNIPLDLRTPSYSDGSTSARANIPEVWSREFWAEYFDEMARDRYNVLSLWSMHPFPSMVKVPEFPDVALNDVWRSLEPLGPTPLPYRGQDAVPPKNLANHEVVRKLTIDQKIHFWRDVMQMAADRGIAIYIFTWNLFVYGTDGKYGIDDKMSNPTTTAYTRASVRELVKTYPLLAGIGITAGENLPADTPGITQEQWLWSTYGEGVRDALKDDPRRRVHLIHRFHETKGDEIQRNWGRYPGYPKTFTYSYKYSVAHMYSSNNPPFIAEVYPYLNGDLKTWLTVRNDDIYSFRWGDPDFAREYILNMPDQAKLVGFYMGPDGFCWGRDYLDKAHPSGEARPLVMQKQWYSFALWGRLSFDPALSNAHFQALLAAKYPGADAPALFAASSAASRIIPQVTRAFWKDIDLLWYPEACAYGPAQSGQGAAFYTVADFMRGAAMPGAGILSVRRWRDRLTKAQSMGALTPLDCAHALMGDSAIALDHVGRLRNEAKGRGDRELISTLDDYEALAHLGIYYAEKIMGACDLALFDSSGRQAFKSSAINHLSAAVGAWSRYAAVRDGQYVSNFFNRIGLVDITALTASAKADVAIASNWTPGSLPFDPAAPETRWESVLPNIGGDRNRGSNS